MLAVISTSNTDGAPDSAARRLVAELPSAEIEVARFERRADAAAVYVWIRGADGADVESVLSSDEQLEGVTRLERTDDGELYKVSWAVDSPLIRCMAATNGAIMQARGTADGWRLKIWFDDSSDAGRFQQCCHDRDVPLAVDRLKSLGDVVEDDGTSISASQREAIELAYRRGYFEQPRRISQEELAEELGISSSAVGGRIRRGLVTLVEEVVIE